MTRLQLFAFSIGLSILFPPANLEAAESHNLKELKQLLEDASQAYSEGLLATDDRAVELERFTIASELFQTAIRNLEEANRPISPELYTNLGNASLQAEELGLAILAYRRALVIDPDYEQAEANLAFARENLPLAFLVETEAGALDTFFYWHHQLSRHEKSGLAATAFLVAALFISLSLITRRKALRNLGILALFAWAVLLGSSRLSRPDLDAAVLTQAASVRTADSLGARLMLTDPAPAGAEVQIVEDRGLWAKVLFADGREGWVDAKSVARVHPQGR